MTVLTLPDSDGGEAVNEDIFGVSEYVSVEIYICEVQLDK